MTPEIRSCSSVIHNGLAEPLLPPTPLSFAPPRLLCLGRLVDNKGFDLALAALSLLIVRFPEIRLTIAGDGPAREQLERLGLKSGVSHAVEFTGWVDPERVPALMNSASVVVVTSRLQEAFSLVALQAALMARPVVATRIGGLTEVVAHQRTGLLVQPESAEALAAAIELLLENPAAAQQMGHAGRSRALENFSWDRYTNAYDTLYRKINGRQETVP
jgi:glycogen(starch) synthase